jgi:RND family efflux transporter MFP subunit
MKHGTRLLLSILLAQAAGCESEAGGKRIDLPDNPPARSRPAVVAAAEGDDAAPTPPVVTEDAAGVLHLTGTTRPHRQSAVAAQGTGMMKQRLVDAGDMVDEGQIIARLDRKNAHLRARQAAAALKAAKVQLSAAQRENKRVTQLGSSVASSRADQAATALEGALAGVEAAQVALDMARKAERDADVKAPYAGLVVQVLKSEGEWVTTMPPSPVIVLAEVTPIDLHVDAPEHLLSRIKVGDRVTATFDALGKTIETSVTRIIPTVKPGTRSFEVVVELPNSDRTILPGVFAEVQLTPSGAVTRSASAKASSTHEAG